MAWSALTGSTGGKGEIPAGKRCRGVSQPAPINLQLERIPIHMKPTPGATLGVRPSSSDEEEKRPQGDEKHPGRAVGQLCCDSFETLNPICGKCVDLPHIKYPGMWKVGVPFPLGYTGHAGGVIARTKFAGHHTDKDNSAEAAFGLCWQEKAGMPKGLIMPPKKYKGTAGEQSHREDVWQRTACQRKQRGG